MTLRDDGPLIASLRSRLFEVLSRHVPRGPVALVDFPAHENAGDAAIWLGELAWLRAEKRPIAYACAHDDYSPDRLAEDHPRGPILLHGGGNFGDLYPRHEQLRRRVLSDFADRKVVQLPQTVKFRDERVVEASARSYGTHPDFTVLVRDDASAELVTQQLGCRVELCPDPAFALGELPRRPPIRAEPLLLLRADHEARPAVAAASVPREDWRPVTFSTLTMLAMARRAARVSRKPRVPRRLAVAAWRGYGGFAQRVAQGGMRLLGEAPAVVSDRLHAHILCMLLGIPHVLLDTRDGKVGNFHRTWTTSSALTHTADDLADAIELARRLVPVGVAS